MASASSTSYIELKISCLYRQLKVSVEVPSSSLPLKLSLCHCNTCRRVSGLLCVTGAALPKGCKEMKIQGETREYYTSRGMIRYFCGDCGTSVYDRYLKSSQIVLCTGAQEMAAGDVELNYRT